MRPSLPQRKSRTSRRPRVERLNDRALLAVLGVAPGPEDNAAALFAEAVATANTTAEPDTIELAAGTYDLASLEKSVLEISSDISIVGISPSQTQIIGAPDGTTFLVNETGSLELSRLTIYALPSVAGGAIWAKGDASLDQVAVIGLVDDGEAGNYEFQATSLIRGGNLQISNSAIVDSAGSAIILGLGDDGAGATSIVGTMISGAAAHAVQGLSTSVVISDSVVFDNGQGVSTYGRGLEVQISGATITRNQNPLNLSSINSFGASRGTPGVTVLSFDSDPAIDISADNVIVGNQADASNREIANGYDQDNWLVAIGEQSQADANVAAVSAVTKIVDDRRILTSDRSLEGINVRLSSVNGETLVAATGRGSSGVFWDPTEEKLFVDSIPRTIDDLVNFSDTLATIDGGQVIGGGSKSRFFANSFGYGVADTNLTAAERNTWNFFTPSEFTSQAGATITPRIHADGVLDFDYTPPADFEGTDTITVRGVTALGQEAEGTITVDVALKTGITMNVAASELDEVIEVAISTSGLGNVTAFDFSVGFDPLVVKLTNADFGREFPFLAEANEMNSSVRVKALGGFNRGSDLVTLTFERIGEGSAGIELLATRDVAFMGQQFTESSFSASVKGQSVGLLGFDQAYFYLSQDDVNRDGAVSARDSLNVVNRLATTNSEGEADSNEAVYQRDYDTNGDGKVSASDALRIINRLARAGTVEGESLGTHPIFGDSATEFIDTSKPIPGFVGRPGLPVDDGTLLGSVDVTAPTADDQQMAELVVMNANGVSLQRSLDSIDDQDLFVIEGSGASIGFGLMSSNADISGDTETDLTLVFFREDGSVMEAYPNTNSQRVIGGAIDTTLGERIYVRVGTTNADTVDYQLDFLELTTGNS
ncbi:dockerin type I domain-containing protein [Rubripirellula amarantea]|nr:dockerin type I domain-containing protein [Rubripirellula amarantea]